MTTIVEQIHTVFAKQKELMEKYEVIEHENGFMVPSSIPVNINDKFDQARLKDFAWRITEELAEAIEQLRFGAVGTAHEELADVLHFMSEMTILLGYEDHIAQKLEGMSPWYKTKQESDTRLLREDNAYTRYYGELTFFMAMACHELKNKPWKQSYRETSEGMFQEWFTNFWINFIYLCNEALLPMEDLIKEYHKKHAVNVTRQKTGY